MLQIVLENQGNWVIACRDGDDSPDPKVYSNWLEQQFTGTGFVELGCNLSELIITSALTETIFFGAISSDEAQTAEKHCDIKLRVGRYYNAVGYGAEYERPSHTIRTNSSQSMLALDLENEFSGFVASADRGRELFRSLTKKHN